MSLRGAPYQGEAVRKSSRHAKSQDGPLPLASDTGVLRLGDQAPAFGLSFAPNFFDQEHVEPIAFKKVWKPLLRYVERYQFDEDDELPARTHCIRERTMGHLTSPLARQGLTVDSQIK